MSIAAGLAFTAAAVVSSSTPATGERQADQTCISCHVDVLNRGLSRRYQHPPFFDHGCPICHLPETAGVPQRAIRDQVPTITGTAASQEAVWTRRRVYPGGSTKTSDHLVVITALSPAETYRFRIVLGETEDRSDEGTSATIWSVLAPKEVVEAGPQGLVLPPLPFVGSGYEISGSVTLTFLGADSLDVQWQTVMPRFGWLELEKTEGMAEAGVSGGLAPSGLAAGLTSANHPVLRAPEDVAIDLCCSCHPTNTLGTSHPVRVYASGGDIRVPEDLPTVKGGMITCVTCHDPHGADGKKLVRETVKTKLCVACHYRFLGTSKATMF